MRPAGNFNPEWGYVAPAPGFMRTLRIALVAGAVGASAGAAVVFSLVDRPAAEESVASRTLVHATPVASILEPSALEAPLAPVSVSAPVAVASVSNLGPAVDERSAGAAASHPANAAAALPESTTVTQAAPSPVPDAAPAPAVAPAVKITATSPMFAAKKPAKRARVAPRYDWSRYDQALRAQGGGYYYAQRGEY
jgi:hypothetical protein